MGIGWNVTLPFVGVYLAIVRNTPLEVIGASYLAVGIAALVSQTLGGRLVDSLGPRTVMLIGYLGSIISALWIGYLIEIRADPYLIAAFYPASALTRGICQPVPGSIIASYQDKHMMNRFSYITIASNLAFGVGPAIGGFLAQYYDYPSLFFFTAGLFGVTAIVSVLTIAKGRLFDPAQRIKAKRLDWNRDRTVILLLALGFFSFIISGFDIQPLSLYSATFLHFSNVQIGYLFSTNGFGVVLLQLPVIRLVQRMKHKLLPLIAANLVCVVGFIIAASSTTFAELELVMIILTLSEMLLTVPMMALIAVFSRPESRGAFQGYATATQNAGRSFANFVGPTLFGILIFEPWLGWYAISVVAVIVTICLVLFSPRMEADYEKAKATSESSSSE
jgi:predicted MFS family arabinose efflux permease